ncbi:MAG: toprim domain-containing protein [Clostridium sp.]
MSFSNGNTTISKKDILNKVSEIDIAKHYFSVNIPALIKSPLRQDNNPSFGLYTRDGQHVYYTDFSTREKGDLFTLLMLLWRVDYNTLLNKLMREIDNIPVTKVTRTVYRANKPSHFNNTELQCKVREWKDYDLEYWGSYGITLDWLKYAEVYPISHKIVIKNNVKYTFPADKYAYAYIERKEGRVTIKIYQPFNTDGYKWSNKHDSSVISLWTKIPEFGDKLCICSSVKDSLCLWCNLGIPAISVQGEGYKISNTAINELRRRYNHIFICFDNDIPGLQDARTLSMETGFTNIIIPEFEGGKDISDAFRSLGKERWIELFESLFNPPTDDLPFEVD